MCSPNGPMAALVHTGVSSYLFEVLGECSGCSLSCVWASAESCAHLCIGAGLFPFETAVVVEFISFSWSFRCLDNEHHHHPCNHQASGNSYPSDHCSFSGARPEDITMPAYITVPSRLMCPSLCLGHIKHQRHHDSDASQSFVLVCVHSRSGGVWAALEALS